jgi:RNA polymerase sigma-70 factor (ECF subfamily)
MARMDADTRAALEADLRKRFDAGDLDGAMTAAVTGYGGELYGFLVGLTRDGDRASDVFAATCERLWRALPAFRWESSFRVWAYTVARNEFLRAARAGGARDKRQVALSEVASVQAAIDRVRTETPVYQQTAVKDELARVREQLDPEDHMLLGLRLDRKLPWNDVARILGDGDPAHLARDAAALRKRFERLKERLRELVRAAGK